MKAFFSRIIAFSKDKKKNEIELKEGLNIITGNSQTGKSALLEITDYCLLNSIECVPKGIITTNTNLYVVILVFENKKLILGRRPYDYEENKNEKGRNRAFYSIENLDFDEKKLDYSYFEKNSQNFIPIKQLKDILLRIFNVGVKSRNIKENDEIKLITPTIRNISSFMFQHQTLVANKFALFYRFEDSIKRNSTIKEFPILAGIVNQNYYNLIIKEEDLVKDIKRNTRQNKIESKIRRLKEEKVKKLREEIFTLLKIVDINDIENFDISMLNLDEITDKKNTLINELEVVKKKILLINDSLADLEKSINLNKIVSEAVSEKVLMDFCEVDNCPICNSKLNNLNKEIKQLKEDKEEVMELMSGSIGLPPFIFEKIDKLKEEKKELKVIEKKLTKEIKTLNSSYKGDKKNSLYQMIIKKKIELEIMEEEMKEFNKEDSITQITDLKDELDEVKEKLSGFDLEKKLSEAESIISTLMNNIAKNLNFEKSLGTPNLKFDLKEFDMYHHLDNQKIFLSSMGSGSNWLTCHLSLFMGLQYYFAKQGVSCSIPNILFLDQPSQVYFPDKVSEDSEDYKRVEDIYKIIIRGIIFIEKNTGILPQVIIVDHADDLNLGEKNNFETFVRARWKKKEEGFIKI